MPDGEPLSDEDAKLVVLARGARARAGTPTGAALRDETGRTYSAADVRLAALDLSALQLAVAQAVAAGSRGVEAAVVITDEPQQAVDTAALAEFGGPDVPVHVCDGAGSPVRQVAAGPQR